MNTLTLISFVLSLGFMTIRGDHNETNTSISKQDIHELMDDFAHSLIRLYTDDSRDSLSEIMEYFDANDQELCYVAACVRKEGGDNAIREHLKTVLGAYDDANITFKTRIRSDLDSLESGYFVRVNSAESKAELIDNQTCESFEMAQYIFLINADSYITKWIIIPPSTGSIYLNCEPVEPTSTDHDSHDNDSDEEVPVCPPEEFCEIMDDDIRDYIMTQMNDYVMEITPDMTIKNIQRQTLDLSEGYRIRIIFENDDGDFMVEYFVKSDGIIDMESVKVQH